VGGVSAEAVIWHDLECGGYRADLGYWRGLARRHDGPVLDIGAGTGRVALALARAGHRVIALENDAALAEELGRRAAGLPVEVRCADACAFTLAPPLALAIVPMQTVHLLERRDAFLRCARRALVGGGTLAVALLGAGVEPFELELAADEVLLDGVRYASAPTALRRGEAGSVVIERRRSRHAAAGLPRSELDRVTLRRCDSATLAREAAAAGFALAGVDVIAPTHDHVGSEIVRLEAVAS
jgi:SAM-dependent methyltransferase